MKKLPKIFVFLFCCLLLIGVMTACSKSGSQSSASSSGTQLPPGTVMGPNGKPIKEEITVALQINPTSMDPHFGTENASRRVTNLIYERLLFFNAFAGTIEPAIAQSWDINGKEITFHLRRDVKFHNGKQLTAADVKYSFDRMATMPRAASFVSMVEKVEIVDDYTVKVTLSAPSPSFLLNLTHMITAIIPEGSGDTIADNPIGCGPYKFVEWKTDDYVLFERFDDFFGGAKPTPRIRFPIIPDHAARLLTLEAGDIDFAILAHNTDYSFLKNRSDITLHSIASAILEYIGFEATKPPFNDIHARRAVSYAINKDAFIDTVFEGEFTKRMSVLLPGTPGYKEVDSCEYDPAKARDELALSAYPNGFNFVLASSPARGLYIEAVQYDLAQVGIKMTFEPVASVPNYCVAGYEGAFITSFSNPELDGGTLFAYLHSKGASSYGNFVNPRLDQLFEAAEIEMDMEKRAAMYAEISDIVAAEAYVVPLYSMVYCDAGNSHVKGAEAHPSTICYYYNLYYEYD